MRTAPHDLIHGTNHRVDLFLAVPHVPTFDKVQNLALVEATGRVAQLERPQEVGGLLEVGADGVNFMDQIFHANDAELSERLLDDGVIGESNTLLLDLAVTTLVQQFSHGLEVGRSPGDVRLHQLEHLQRAVVQPYKDTSVDLDQAEQLQNLARLGRDLVDTLDTAYTGCQSIRNAFEKQHIPDHKGQGLGRNVELAGSFGFTAHADFVTLRGTVLLDVLLGALEDDLAAVLLFLRTKMDDQSSRFRTAVPVPVLL